MSIRKIKKIKRMQNEYKIELDKKLKELEKYKRDFKRLQDYLCEYEKLAILGQLLGGIIHNINTPIMSMSGALYGLNELIDEYKDSIDDNTVVPKDHMEIAQEMDGWVHNLRGNLDYVAKVISTVKMQVKNEQGNLSDEFSIEELIEKINLLMGYQIKSSGCKIIVVNNINRNIKINGKIAYLVQIMDNLITNAIQAYKGKGGEIKIVFYQKKESIIISVEDKAGGIEGNIKDKLFKEIVSTKGKNGSGLGLYLSNYIIKGKLNGNIWFNSIDGTGSVFCVLIPIKNT
jgi:C4-dicarboxylate-specific signal transduction histidine kinase